MQLGIHVVVGRYALPVAGSHTPSLVHLELHLHHSQHAVERVFRWGVELNLTESVDGVDVGHFDVAGNLDSVGVGIKFIRQRLALAVLDIDEQILRTTGAHIELDGPEANRLHTREPAVVFIGHALAGVNVNGALNLGLRNALVTQHLIGKLFAVGCTITAASVLLLRGPPLLTSGTVVGPVSVGFLGHELQLPVAELKLRANVLPLTHLEALNH
mmetsp:Transcript_98349/g.143980  ORF Transcript_98349/g.143980 Transcript_98349/m.143980 type:complete len:215 (+) Transcript_98349:862-1506(+)